jgi:hypothetical protein
VLQQAARVAVVPLGARRGQRPEGAAHGRVPEDRPDQRRQAGMGELRGEELQEALELVGIAPERGRERRGILLGRLDRADVELQPVPELLDAPEHPHGIPLVEAAVEQLDVPPDARLDPAARVDELEREVRRAVLRPPPLLPGDREHAFDDAVRDELGDRRHGRSLGRSPVGTVRPWPTSSRFARCGTVPRPRGRSTGSSRRPTT